MSQFPTAGHLVSWAKLCPRTIQSGAKSTSGKTGKGNPYLRGVLGDAAAAAGKTNTFLGERYRRIVKRRGKLKALVAVARSILVIIWTAPIPPPGSTTSAPTTTPPASTPNAAPATTSATNGDRLPRHPHPPPDPNLHRHNTDPAPQAPPGDFACPLTWVIFRSGWPRALRFRILADSARAALGGDQSCSSLEPVFRVAGSARGHVSSGRGLACGAQPSASATSRRMKADGHTVRDIARSLRVSRATLCRYLATEVA